MSKQRFHFRQLKLMQKWNHPTFTIALVYFVPLIHYTTCTNSTIGQKLIPCQTQQRDSWTACLCRLPVCYLSPTIKQRSVRNSDGPLTNRQIAYAWGQLEMCQWRRLNTRPVYAAMLLDTVHPGCAHARSNWYLPPFSQKELPVESGRKLKISPDVR